MFTFQWRNMNTLLTETTTIKCTLEFARWLIEHDEDLLIIHVGWGREARSYIIKGYYEAARGRLYI